MATFQKKVSFYRLTLEKREKVPHQRRLQTTQIGNLGIEEYFKTIYTEKMQVLSNKNKATTVQNLYGKYVVEILSYEGHRVFAKIGQQNSSNTVALRDQGTLESENVPMTTTQALELYTFCLIDFETGIISYMAISGAPRISAIRDLFTNNLLSENIIARISIILSDDIIQLLMHKKRIGSLSLTVAVPSDEVLSSSMGIDPNSFDILRNIRSRKATFSISAQRNKNIFASNSKLGELVATIQERYGSNLKSLKVNAHDENEPTNSYELLHSSFTKTVTISQQIITQTEFLNALENTYNANKAELLKYCRS